MSMFRMQSIKPIKHYELHIVVRLFRDELDEGGRSSYLSEIRKDNRHLHKIQTFNCGCMLCQSGESSGRFILYRMGGRV